MPKVIKEAFEAIENTLEEKAASRSMGFSRGLFYSERVRTVSRISLLDVEGPLQPKDLHPT